MLLGRAGERDAENRVLVQGARMIHASTLDGAVYSSASCGRVERVLADRDADLVEALREAVDEHVGVRDGDVVGVHADAATLFRVGHHRDVRCRTDCRHQRVAAPEFRPADPHLYRDAGHVARGEIETGW